MAKKKKTTKKKNKKNSSIQPIELSPAAKYILWTAGACVWLFLALSLISYDTADDQLLKTGEYGVHSNVEDFGNLMGTSGANLAHAIYNYFGIGAWLPLFGAFALLVAAIIKKPVNQIILRTLGLILMATATSGIVALTSDDLNTWPNGYGGALGDIIDATFYTRFGTLGSTLVYLVSFWIGAILAADQTVLLVTKALGSLILKLKNVNVPKPNTFPSISFNSAATAKSKKSKAKSKGKKNQKATRRRRRKLHTRRRRRSRRHSSFRSKRPRINV